MSNKYDHLRPQNIVNSKEEARRIEREARFFAAEHDRDIATLDFHGMQLHDVEFEIDQFLLDHADSETLRIVTGHGLGIIKKAVGAYLEKIYKKPDSVIEVYKMSLNLPQYILLLKRD